MQSGSSQGHPSSGSAPIHHHRSNATPSYHHHRHSRSRQPVEGSFCQYSHRICMQNKLEGYNYCIKHILEDGNAPYKQCNYVSNKSGKRCVNAAARTERKDGYCLEHTRRTIMLRQRASRKRKPPETPDTLLEELEVSHHRGNGQEVRRARSLESLAGRILEYASSSDSDLETVAVEHGWRGDCDSDAESVDSEQEDPLKHAGVYTAEEVALLTRDKLIRLQSLYIDQFKRLQHLLKEKRRNYLHTVHMDRQQFGSILSAKDEPEQKDVYEKLDAMKRYHRRYGKERLLHRQSQERRKQVSDGALYQPPSYTNCTYEQPEGERCNHVTLPLSKYCFKHILEDPFQVLFTPCRYGDGSCERPTMSSCDNSSHCLLHCELLPYQHRLPKRQNSDEGTQSSKEVEGETIDVLSVDSSPLLLPTTGNNQSVPVRRTGINQFAKLGKKEIKQSVPAQQTVAKTGNNQSGIEEKTGNNQSATPVKTGNNQSTTEIKTSSNDDKTGHNQSEILDKTGHNHSSTEVNTGYNQSVTEGKLGNNQSEVVKGSALKSTISQYSSTSLSAPEKSSMIPENCENKPKVVGEENLKEGLPSDAAAGSRDDCTSVDQGLASHLSGREGRISVDQGLASHPSCRDGHTSVDQGLASHPSGRDGRTSVDQSLANRPSGSDGHTSVDHGLASHPSGSEAEGQGLQVKKREPAEGADPIQAADSSNCVSSNVTDDVKSSEEKMDTN